MEKPILSAMLSVSSTSLTDPEKKLLHQCNPLGVSLFSRNIANKEQLKKLTSEIHAVIGRDNVLIAVDQEGGRVRRLKEPDYIPFASQSTLGTLAIQENEHTAGRAVINHCRLTSYDLKEVNINLNYAPVLDLSYPQTNPVLKSRSFGSDEKLVARLGEIMVEEYIINGICPCIKHLPGHGRAETDPHLSLPVIRASLKELERDFYPFQQLNYAPAGMTAHILIPAVDEKNPATMSKKVINSLIRGLIGFEGFLISDAIDMKALPGTLGEKTSTCLEVGCDAICYCMGDYDELNEVIANCKPLSDKAQDRLKQIQNIIEPINISKIVDEYQKTIGKIEQYDDNYDATEVLHHMMKHKGEI